MNTIDTILRRSSYRGEYEDTPVAKEDLEIILQAGLAAPSGCNKQTTSLIAIDDPKLLKQLYEIREPSVGTTAPAMIAVLTEKIIAYRDRCFHVQDYAAAIQNMLLAISCLGYESCWVEGHITDITQTGRKMADALGVPEHIDLVCYLPVGRAKKPASRAKKKDFDQRAWFNGYKSE